MSAEYLGVAWGAKQKQPGPPISGRTNPDPPISDSSSLDPPISRQNQPYSLPSQTAATWPLTSQGRADMAPPISGRVNLVPPISDSNNLAPSISNRTDLAPPISWQNQPGTQPISLIHPEPGRGPCLLRKWKRVVQSWAASIFDFLGRESCLDTGEGKQRGSPSSPELRRLKSHPPEAT